MLIGIDMMAVQSPQSRDTQTGRLARQLVSALLRLDANNQYVLYVHEGLPRDLIPSDAQCIMISPAPALDASIHEVIDNNPDRLDWLLLLDPFASAYRVSLPGSTLNGLKLASLVLDLAPSVVDDRRLTPMRHHDAILAVSESVASEARRRLGSAAWRVSTIPVASGLGSEGEVEELVELGVVGPYLFASVNGGSDRANLEGILESYLRLTPEQRSSHQLVISGTLDDPWGALGYLNDRGCAEGLVMVGDVDEATLSKLYRGCSVYLSPSIDEGPGLSLVEAMRCGAPIVAGIAGDQIEIVGDAGMLVDPTDPDEIAGQVDLLLSDPIFRDQLCKAGLARSTGFGWKPAVSQVIAAFRGDAVPPASPRFRADLAHPTLPPMGALPEGFEGSQHDAIQAVSEEE